MTRQVTKREDIANKALKEVYLGDGLYCSYDGFQYILRAPRDEGDHHVALEPSVLEAFNEHQKYIRKLHAELTALDKANAKDSV